jgi:hypothetical protein
VKAQPDRLDARCRLACCRAAGMTPTALNCVCARREDGMLGTKLRHLETAEAFEAALRQNENVMVCCGRMGPLARPHEATDRNVRNS